MSFETSLNSAGKWRVLFMGTGEIALPTFQCLMSEPEIEVCGLVTQPDKPVGRGNILTAPKIKELALAGGIPVFQPQRVRLPEALEPLAALQVDLIVVMAYGQILPKDLLDLPRVACLNLHASILPKYRGAAPIQAPILAGDRETGMTVMYMDVGLDTGDILLIRKLPIRRRETGGGLHDRLALLAREALLDAMRELRNGTAPRVPQDSSLATHTAKLTRESGRMDWTCSAVEIERQIRAFNPWPGTWCVLPGEPERKLKLYSAIVKRRVSGPPGEVLSADGNGILLGTGEGSLLLREVQEEGRKRMTASAYLLGRPIKTGARFKIS